MKSNSIFLILVIIFLASCKTTVVSQEKKQKREKPKFMDFADDANLTLAPNTITLEGIIVENTVSKKICNKNYSKTIEVKIIKVNGSGSSITNMPLKNKTYTFILNNLTKKHRFTKSKKMSFTVKEKICDTMKKGIYEIIN